MVEENLFNRNPNKFTKEVSEMIIYLEQDNIYFQMEQFIKECFKII